MRVQPDTIINGFDRSYYLLTQPDVAASHVDPMAHFNTFGRLEGRFPDGLFDTAYYLANNPDVAAAKVNPLQHYFAFGFNEGRNPSAAFNTSAYLAANPDVAAAHLNPLQHYLQYGAFEGRSIGVSLTTATAGNDFLIGTSGANVFAASAGNDFVIGAGGDDFADGGSGIDTARFSSDFSAYTFAFVSDLVIVDGPEGHDTFRNFERFAFRDGTIERNDSNPLVDDLYYFAQNRDVWNAGLDAAQHYHQYGWHEGRNPNQYFDTNYYLSNNPDVAAAGIDPLEHYLNHGASEGRNPSALFNSSAYLAANQDVADAHLNPLLHFLVYGQFEGRQPLGVIQSTVIEQEDTDHVFVPSDFTFSLPNPGISATIDASAIANGTLFVDFNDDGIVDPGEALSGPTNVVLASDIDAGRLVFRPDAEESGNGYAVFSYTVTDGTETTAPAVMTINITSVADAPDKVTFTQSGDLAEGSLGGTAVGTATASDPDPGTTITFSLRNSNGSAHTGPFTINSATGAVTVAAGATGDTIDFEAAETGIELVIRATDQTGLFRDQVVLISIGDVAETTLQAIEGYIANATVFVDANDNGEFDAGEYSLVTDAVGGFKIVGAHGNHAIILIGGNGAVDTATGLPFEGILRAPAGSTVLSPITTLIQSLVSSGASVATATSQVVAALGLPNVDYTTFDPITASLSGDPNGDAVFAAGVQVYNTIVQASSLLSGAGADSAAAADAVVGALAQQIQTAANAASTISLSNSTTLTEVITSAGSTTATDVSATAAGAASVISGSNTLIQDAVDDPGTTGANLLQAVTGAATVAQGDAAAALEQAGQSGNTAAAESSFTGTNLETSVNTATAAVDNNAVAGPNGDNTLVGTAGADILDAQLGNDTIYAGGDRDLLTGGPGDDLLDGDTLDGNQAARVLAFDRADYSAALEGISVNMATGVVTGGASVGTDTLRGIEGIVGTGFVDNFNSSTYTTTTVNNGGAGYTFNGGIGALGVFNQFEGRGGNDSIIGNGFTRAVYANATAAVTVNLQTGVATGDASVGTDTLSGVSFVRGSAFNDTITGRLAAPGQVDQLEGLGGDDFIDGNGGFDRARYDLHATGALGIIVNLGAGTVTGRDAEATAVVGNDTLRSIESIRATNSDDILDASTFTAISVNGGGNNDQFNFSELEGLGGNDSLTGNGNTRVVYTNALAGVTVIMTGFGVGTVSGDGSIGLDTLNGGINHIRGSNFNDSFTGFNNGFNNFEQFEGWAGDDLINGGGGLDRVRYDGNNGDFSGIPLILGMSFNLAAGTATARDANALFNYGNDTLRGIEVVRGTSADDIYTAVNFSTSSTNAGAGLNAGLFIGTYFEFNEFDGGAGNDDVTGNGGTRVNYQNSNGGVTVNLGTGATGAAGTDTFHGGISAVRGSNAVDSLTGTNNAAGTIEIFEGMSGNDTINGQGGDDLVSYLFHNTGGFGVVVTRNGGSSTVTGVNGTATAGVGTDTLTGIELVRGTNFNDSYNATGFIGFNQFEGALGIDDITGNGNTRIAYHNTSGGGVNVDLVNNTVFGAAGNDTLHGGINSVWGSQQTDSIRGSAGSDFLRGFGGNDAFVYITSSFGNDQIDGFIAGAGTDDFLQFDDSVFANFNAVLAASQQVGADVLITLDGANSIRLTNVDLANFHANDVLITF